MSFDAARLLIHQLDDGELEVGHASDDVQEWLESLGLPDDLLIFLKWYWPQNKCLIGPIRIYCSEELAEQSDQTGLLKRQLLQVGSGPNGDLFAIDFSIGSCPVGFVSHSDLWEKKVDPRSVFQPAARSFATFLYQLSEGRYFPCDYYAATDFNEFLRAEATHQKFAPYDPI